jgi:hypothetical protein
MPWKIMIDGIALKCSTRASTTAVAARAGATAASAVATVETL